MHDDNTPTPPTCSACESPLDGEQAIVDMDFKFQGKIPLLVIYYRCTSCGHEWTDAHEPLNQPDLPNDAVGTPDE